ncbi:MAG: flagellar M-ring protein FliF [Halobacteriovoraceae bacterium]|nr:flagellar M-ring protein FliF [Halobacteriovoraceae bacterium]
MQDFLEKVFRNFLEFYNGLETIKKIAVIILSAIIVAIMASIIIWTTNTRFKVLYENLNDDDVAVVVKLLSDAGVEYRVSDDHATVLIPEDMIEVMRLELAKKDVSFSGTVGYEVLDNQSFGTSSYVQKINRQRALEGELVKTIKYIKGVKRARVHLSIPESSPFVADKKPPGASVVLEVDRGVTLTSMEIKGIQSLVSSSVDGMRPEHVVIVDSRGKQLSENIGDELTAYTANRLALESKLNKQYENQVEEILSKVVGEGKVIAKVAVNLDFTQSVSTETAYDQETAAIVSEVSNSQKIKGSRPSPQGIPGARSNLPGEQPQPGIPETRNDVDKELKTKNYNIPSKVTKSSRPTATVKSLNVAVMVDGKHVPTLDENGNAMIGEDGKAVNKYEPWSDADLTNFSAIVASAVGIDTKRGDKIVIKNMEFAQEDLAAIDALMRERENRELIRNVVKYLAIGLTISLFFFFVVRPFVQWITDNTVESVEDFLPKTLEELEKVQANQKLPGLEDALPQIEEKLNPEKIEGNMLREKIISLVDGNPAKAAQVLHEMIHSTESDKQIA